ncbi:MAG: ThuA domain-containing protein [Acutalibacteraceae bacterium]|nr:ThuA domain-containing protein [Acutalibacteraceae bacterium]
MKNVETAKEIYPDGIHMTLKRNLEDEEITVTTYTMDTINEITDEALKNIDVMLWWGHMRHQYVPDEVAKSVQNAVVSGMGIIFLHSAHHSKPFKLLMGTPCSLHWRDDGDEEYLWVVDPSHPIAQGIDRYIKIDHEETYSEPFSVPEPDKVVFIANYEGGEVFRSGCCWQRGYGKVFYFQPGHESFPTYHNPQVIKVLKNAIHWAYSDFRRVIDCPFVKKVR